MTTITGHILVVDDDPMNRLKLSRGLEHQGHIIGLAENGQEALEMIATESFDLVLLDIVMPTMDGYEVLARMKEDDNLSHIPVIMISAEDQLESVIRCIEMGAEDHLSKPFDPVLLRARITTSLDRKYSRDQLKKNLELERSYLERELRLRQSEKLATLGKLSAGLAHEMNNPAAMAQRATKQLKNAIAQLLVANIDMNGLRFSEAQRDVLTSLDQRVQNYIETPIDLDALARSDHEGELETLLDDQSVEDAWELVAVLVNLGYQHQTLTALAEQFSKEQLSVLLRRLCRLYDVNSLLTSINEGTSRISEIVNVMKSYSYMDQAPVQLIDVHEGLDSTLVIMHNKLKSGVIVRREYAENLPSIQAYGSELNQVWTNIIDNAIDAMQSQGELTLRTYQEGQYIIVAIEDNGSGIPEEIQSTIFDPFMTTKPPGQGIGLGLNISHNIVVQKHKGKLTQSSEPNKTTFLVWLPINFEELQSNDLPQD